MIKMRPYAPSNRIAIRDSSIDDDISDDIDDDVFIKDARSAKINEEKGLKRPLMAPRRKNGKTHNSVPIMKKHRRCWKCCEPFCYGLAALTILIALIILAAFILTLFPIPLQKIKVWLRKDTISFGSSSLNDGINTGTPEFIPCTQISVQKFWMRTFPRINSESPVRKADLNGDNVMDIIFGYGVDDNVLYEGYPLPNCKSAQQGEEVPCEGGVIALNGATGALLWQTWNVGNVFSLHCSIDIDRDGYMDCIAAGRLGLIFAINGRNGNTIWEYHEIEIETNSPVVIDLYTINVIRDLNDDGIPEVIAVHVEEREESKAGHIKLISGKTGQAIRTIPTPFKEEVFVPLQVITKEDGTELLLIITGGQNTAGGIYSIRLLSLMQFTSEKEFIPLFQVESSGFMVPSVVTDITGDLISDIVVSSFNSTIYAFDGHTSSMIWNYTFPNSESVSAIVPGHFNHDNITDFMIKYNTGPGFPVYYYSQTTVLDGRTGLPLLDAMITDSGGASSLLGGVSISQSFGGDFFLHWQMQCRDKYDAKDAYEFIPDSDIISQARADTCRLRYNTTNVAKLYAIARHIEPPGAVIFSTDDIDIQEIPLNNAAAEKRKNPTSPFKHPKMLKKKKKIPLTTDEETDTTKIPKEKVSTTLQKSSKSHFTSKASDPSHTGQLAYNTPIRDYKEYDAAESGRNADDYDLLYNENEVAPQVAAIQNDRPIHLRSKYPSASNRDVRSDVTSFESTAATNESQTEKIIISSPNNNIRANLEKQEEPLTLWDLEMEKEANEAIQNSLDSDEMAKKGRERRKRRRRRSLNNDSVNSNGNFSDSTSDWFLPSISSTGVLVKSLSNIRSSLDFIFVLNLRDSETYPPLLLPQDINCMEDKISAYKSFTVENLRVLQKQFLKKCLNARLGNIIPPLPKYESQLVITRIGITCTCRSLQPGEICSELNEIDAQKWTEFMGRDSQGIY